MQLADVGGGEAVFGAEVVERGVLRDQQSLRLGLVHVAHVRDAEPVAQHAATRAGLKLRLRPGGNVLAAHAAASLSCNAFKVRPCSSFHSMRPLALRPSTTAAAVEGELNT